jgi:hypothetical protein
MVPGALSLGKKQQGYEVDYHPLSNTEVKIGWGYTSTPPRTFMACNRTTVPLYDMLSYIVLFCYIMAYYVEQSWILGATIIKKERDLRTTQN